MEGSQAPLTFQSLLELSWTFSWVSCVNIELSSWLKNVLDGFCLIWFVFCRNSCSYFLKNFSLMPSDLIAVYIMTWTFSTLIPTWINSSLICKWQIFLFPLPSKSLLILNSLLLLWVPFQYAIVCCHCWFHIPPRLHIASSDGGDA